jgi:hypothetical protein
MNVPNVFLPLITYKFPVQVESSPMGKSMTMQQETGPAPFQ